MTGVAGFLGSAVARALAARGHSLRGTIRSTSPTANLADFPGELVVADLRDPQAAANAMTGITTLYHVAADYRLWASDRHEIERNNRAMTEAVMTAARDAKVKRIVYTSSVATLLPDPAGPADETRAASPGEAVGAYKRSKVVAERLVEAMIADGLPAVITNPSTPIGPRDVRPTPTGRIVVEAANGKMPAFVDGGLNLVQVDDVAHGHILAAERGRIGERYILGGQDVTIREMLAAIARISGRKAPTIRLPVAPLFPLAFANEHWARLTRREPFLTIDSLRMSRHAMYYSSAKATRELGYAARPYEEALANAIGWFRKQGMVR